MNVPHEYEKRYKFDFYSYRRRFKYPLSTSHGDWYVRKGIILRLSDENGQVGWGEIAPIPWFGSESLEQALDFCRQLNGEITLSNIDNIPSILPACQFGLESAWESVIAHPYLSYLCPSTPLTYSFLLPTGKAALEAWQIAWNQGHRTLKWKIGVANIEYELKLFEQLTQVLPPSVKLRLDSNGGLSRQETHQWLQVADSSGIVEFLEQPLPPEKFKAMLEMSHQYSTPIALDESVATLDKLESCYQQGWRGIVVIKPSIAGSPKRLRQLCQQWEIDAVFSSALETLIGTKAALKLAGELSKCDRAVGFGVNQYFDQDFNIDCEQGERAREIRVTLNN
ncbi:MAG: o-succinylbenzoate synthase [Symploca sp. SIO1C4]|uniref:o-succinylbenzoate synthase n=1 Tax=Symploca sp. SIO1C4 TaxID=2607765 RepID=A0A6B3NBV8_9CYAN|nr:o-succinylbenzoate synthase [Symploca sp. SIO1C4]